MEDWKIIFFNVGAVALTFIAIGIILFALYYGNKLRLKKIAEEMQAKQGEKDMYNALVQTQEDEKLRLARNLHDEVKPILATIKNKLAVYGLKNKNNDDYRDTMTLVSQAYEIIDNTVYDLAPSFLIFRGIFHSLKFQLTQANNSAFKVDFRNYLPQEGENKHYFSDNQTLHIFRVVLELFNNMVKHDKPTAVTVNVEEVNNSIIFLFMHNGKGINDAAINELRKSSAGLGLKSIQARVALLNGTLHYFIKPNDHAGVRFTIPFSL